MSSYLELTKKLDGIYQKIITDPANLHFTNKGFNPLYLVSPKSKIIIIGQAPGIKAQEHNMIWRDLSGARLTDWLGVDRNTFYNPDIIGMLPMDFYYPGKGKSGDLPPRKDFASKWHPQILSCLPNVELIILVGKYAQMYYLNETFNNTLTQTVKSYKSYLPDFFPIVHPSPLNFRWLSKNPWFESEVIPHLKLLVNKIINK